MKKRLLLFLFCAAGMVSATAQSFGTKIGQTYFDQHFVYSGGGHIAQKSNGAVSVIWPESCWSEIAGAYPKLGPGYNHHAGSGWQYGFDGTCDEPDSDFGVSTTRMQAPQLLVFSSGKEMVIGHDASGLIATSRSDAGVGGMSDWSPTQPLAVSGALANAWPKAVSSGSFLHLVATCDSCIPASGVISPIRYFRSSDEGATWDITDLELPGMDAASFTQIGAGNFAVTARQDTVAIVAGIAAPGNQWAMWKSTDNGSTWSKTILKSFALTDTVTTVSNPNVQPYLPSLLAGNALYEGNDKHHTLLIDHSGNVHVWSGYMLLGIDRNNPQSSQPFPLRSEGIWYWKEGMINPTLAVNQRDDLYPAGHANNYVGNGTYLTPARTAPYGYTGLLSMPAAAIAQNGDLYLIFSGALEGHTDTQDSSGVSFRNLYLTRSTNNGNQWMGPAINIPVIFNGAPAYFEEMVFPGVTTYMKGNTLFLTYQYDDAPGLHALDNIQPETLNEILYAGMLFGPDHPPFLVDPYITAAPETFASATVLKLVPNPTLGITQLQLTLAETAKVSVSVTDLLGRQVAALPAQHLPAGENQQLPLDISTQPSGVYLCTVLVNGQPRTLRLSKE